MKIPEPKYMTYPESFFGCGINNQPTEKTDCYFYTEVQDMGGHIPTCNYYGKLGHCPCGNCEKYIENSKMFECILKTTFPDVLKKRKIGKESMESLQRLMISNIILQKNAKKLKNFKKNCLQTAKIMLRYSIKQITNF